MKYIIYIIFIASIATFSFIYSSDTTPVQNDYAIRVDGRTISMKEIDTLKKQSPSLFAHSKDLPQSLIVREVLIAEALRQKIDQEDAFRQRIKTFYEQSLVKILVKRKMDSIHYITTDKELEAYINLQGRLIDIDLVPLDSEKQPIFKKREKLSGPFLDFSLSIRMAMLLLNEKSTSGPIELFDQVYVIIVKTIGEKDPNFNNYDTERDFVVIQEFRQQQLFELWQKSLVQQANIVIAPKQKEHGN